MAFFGGASSGSDLMNGGGSASTVLKAPINQYAIQQPTADQFFNSTTAAPGGQTDVLGATTALDPAAAEAARLAAAAAAKAAEASRLRGDITGLIGTVNSIYDGRYGQVDAAARDQSGKLDSRFQKESGDVTRQVGEENQKVGAAYAGRGAFDSSYRGNSVDTVTKAGESQIADLGTELEENRGKIGAWVSGQKASFDAGKGAMQTILSRLAEETEPSNLVSLRNTLDAKIAELKGADAQNNTNQQNLSALASIAPSNDRAVKLQTTLSQIIAGNADSTTKQAIGQKLIQNAGLSPDEQQKLAIAFSSDLQSDKQEQA